MLDILIALSELTYLSAAGIGVGLIVLEKLDQDYPCV